MIQPLWRTVWRFLRRLEIKPPYEPAIPLLGIYPEETVIQKGTRAPSVHCSTTDNSQGAGATSTPADGRAGQEAAIRAHNRISLSHKQEGISVAEPRWVNRAPVTQSEVSQKEKNKDHILTHIYIWNLEKWH